MMETEVQITLLFLGAGILAYVIIPGLLVIWDRVLDYMGGANARHECQRHEALRRSKIFDRELEKPSGFEVLIRERSVKSTGAGERTPAPYFLSHCHYPHINLNHLLPDNFSADSRFPIDQNHYTL